jgi:hypothetical protein
LDAKRAKHTLGNVRVHVVTAVLGYYSASDLLALERELRGMLSYDPCAPPNVTALTPMVKLVDFKELCTGVLEDEGSTLPSHLPRVATFGAGRAPRGHRRDATAAHCLQEIDRIKALPYVADKLSGYYKLDASCHDEDYIKRQQ